MPCLAVNNLSFFAPVGNNCRALLTLQIETGKGDKVISANFNICSFTVDKAEIEFKSVINLIGGYVGSVAGNGVNLTCDKEQHLVDKMHTPVKYHTAAIRLMTTPIGGDAAGTMDS